MAIKLLDQNHELDIWKMQFFCISVKTTYLHFLNLLDCVWKETQQFYELQEPYLILIMSFLFLITMYNFLEH